MCMKLVILIWAQTSLWVHRGTSSYRWMCGMWCWQRGCIYCIWLYAKLCCMIMPIAQTLTKRICLWSWLHLARRQKEGEKPCSGHKGVYTVYVFCCNVYWSGGGFLAKGKCMICKFCWNDIHYWLCKPVLGMQHPHWLIACDSSLGGKNMYLDMPQRWDILLWLRGVSVGVQL